MSSHQQIDGSAGSPDIQSCPSVSLTNQNNIPTSSSVADSSKSNSLEQALKELSQKIGLAMPLNSAGTRPQAVASVGLADAHEDNAEMIVRSHQLQKQSKKNTEKPRLRKGPAGKGHDKRKPFSTQPKEAGRTPETVNASIPMERQVPKYRDDSPERGEAQKRPKTEHSRATARLVDARPRDGPPEKFVPRVICKYWMEGRCGRGIACTFSHAHQPIRTAEEARLLAEPCRFFMGGSCVKGEQCMFSHDLSKVPCRFFHLKGGCKEGPRCKYSHASIDRETRESMIKEEKEQASLRAAGIDSNKSELGSQVLRAGLSAPRPHEMNDLDESNSRFFRQIRSQKPPSNVQETKQTLDRNQFPSPSTSSSPQPSFLATQQPVEEPVRRPLETSSRPSDPRLRSIVHLPVVAPLALSQAQEIESATVPAPLSSGSPTEEDLIRRFNPFNSPF